MFLMHYPSIRGGNFPDCAKKATCKLPDYTKTFTWTFFHAYIDAHYERSIDENPVY